MLPDVELLQKLSRDEVIAEVKRCVKISKERYGQEMDELGMINTYLRGLGFEPINNEITQIK